MFTLLGFIGIYAVLSLLFLALVYQVIATGPEREQPEDVSIGRPVTSA